MRGSGVVVGRWPSTWPETVDGRMEGPMVLHPKAFGNIQKNVKNKDLPKSNLTASLAMSLCFFLPKTPTVGLFWPPKTPPPAQCSAKPPASWGSLGHWALLVPQASQAAAGRTAEGSGAANPWRRPGRLGVDWWEFLLKEHKGFPKGLELKLKFAWGFGEEIPSRTTLKFLSELCWLPPGRLLVVCH